MFEPKSRFLVYGLIDPRNGELRYVGKSSKGLGRPKEHLYPSGRNGTTHNARWLKQMWEDGERAPLILVLEECESDAQVLAREMVLIALFKEAGFNLTNITVGGDGSQRLPDKPVPEEVKKKMSEAWTPEKHKARSEAYTGRHLTEETKKRLSASHKGRVMPPETRAKISAAQKGVPRLYAKRPLTPEQLEARKKLFATDEYRKAVAAGWTPEARARQAGLSRGRTRSEEALKKASVSLKAAWASDPERRAAMSKRAIKRLSDPAVRATQAARCKASWEDPVYRQRVMDGRAAGKLKRQQEAQNAGAA